MTGLEKFEYFLRLFKKQRRKRESVGFSEWFNEVLNTIGGSHNTVANIKRVLRLGAKNSDELLKIIKDFNNSLDEDSKQKIESITAFTDFCMVTW